MIPTYVGGEPTNMNAVGRFQNQDLVCLLTTAEIIHSAFLSAGLLSHTIHHHPTGETDSLPLSQCATPRPR